MRTAIIIVVIIVILYVWDTMYNHSFLFNKLSEELGIVGKARPMA